MSHVKSFAPIAAPDARVLILGSMPGRASLEANQYYAFGRNQFWPIMEGVYGIAADLPYEERCAGLIARRVAVWDVMKACFRTTSLDADIDESSIVPNDFASFLEGHPAIRGVFFNGTRAEKSYRKHVIPSLPDALCELPLVRLPSTSPAHASLSFQLKLDEWEGRLR
ncbi:MAG: DNA-deoxyinosine glycosylase [Gemmatimonadetes bacterium]|nr:DNA-deoxyinosine glycosylase [Gemmatimonadota bacterium]